MGGAAWGYSVHFKQNKIQGLCIAKAGNFCLTRRTSCWNAGIPRLFSEMPNEVWPCRASGVSTPTATRLGEAGMQGCRGSGIKSEGWAVNVFTQPRVISVSGHCVPNRFQLYFELDKPIRGGSRSTASIVFTGCLLWVFFPHWILMFCTVPGVKLMFRDTE